MLSFFFKGFRGVVEHARNPGERSNGEKITWNKK